MRILLTGRAGQVGSALEQALAPLGDLVAWGRAELDLAQTGPVRAKVVAEKPDVIVNAAAYTAVDRAEQEREAAFAVNAGGVQELAAAAGETGALLIHFSTDYVFDGSKPSPYVEADAPNPLGIYGRSKLEGERLLAASGCRHFIFRTSWVYAAAGRNFMHAILNAAKTRPEVRVVDDQRGAPTSNLAIADAVAHIVADEALRQRASGIYHLTAGGDTSWHGFARAIFDARAISTPLVPIRSDEYPAAAARPRNSRLDCSKAADIFGVALADWRDGLAALLRTLH